MPLEPAQRHPVMCLTQDYLPISHVEQAERLCAVGAKWIQVRMKAAAPATWVSVARDVTTTCHRHGALCIVNDSVELALAVGADGAHLGKLDLDWREARRIAGGRLILGGTVNNAADARRALAAGCLDYVGVGPLRFTSNKQNLAPLLGVSGIRDLVAQLDGLPAWAIGGVEADDLPALRAAGLAGVAVSSALYREGRIEENYRVFRVAWSSRLEELRS